MSDEKYSKCAFRARKTSSSTENIFKIEKSRTVMKNLQEEHFTLLEHIVRTQNSRKNFKILKSQCSKPWYPCQDPSQDLGKDIMTMQDRAKSNHDLGKDAKINDVLDKGSMYHDLP